MRHAEWKDEHEQTETETTISVFSFPNKKLYTYNFFFFENRKPKPSLRFRDEEYRKPNRLSNFQTAATLEIINTIQVKE